MGILTAMTCCKKRVFSGQRNDTGGHQCTKKAVDGMDGYCSLHYPPNAEKRQQDLEAKWKRESDERAAVRKKQADARALELHKIEAFDYLLASLKELREWHSKEFQSNQWIDSRADSAIERAERGPKV